MLAAVGTLPTGYGRRARACTRVAMPTLLLAGFAVSSAGNLLTGLAWAVAAAFAVQAVRGLGIAALDVAATTWSSGGCRRTRPDLRQPLRRIGVAAALAYLLGGLLL